MFLYLNWTKYKLVVCGTELVVHWCLEREREREREREILGWGLGRWSVGRRGEEGNWVWSECQGIDTYKQKTSQSLIHIIIKNYMAHIWAVRERARAKLCAGQAYWKTLAFAALSALSVFTVQVGDISHFFWCRGFDGQHRFNRSIFSEPPPSTHWVLEMRLGHMAVTPHWALNTCCWKASSVGGRFAAHKSVVDASVYLSSSKVEQGLPSSLFFWP